MHMFEAALFAGLAATGLVVGYVLFHNVRPKRKDVGLATALGAGLLMAVVAYSLVQESIETSQAPWRVALGLGLGAITYYTADSLMGRKFGDGNAGLPLALGAVLDGIPESLVIGISVALTGEASIPLVVAAFVANVAESLAATSELEEGGDSPSTVFRIWLAILVGSVTAAVIGYAIVAGISPAGGAAVNGFAGGAVLMVLANAMIPEGYRNAGRIAGLLVVAGFAVGFALEHL
jgi:zinc transporter, ZIP family